MSTRKLVYYVATSVDHYIAHTNEAMDGMLTEGDHVSDYLDSLRSYDTVLMGRKTYEWGYQFGIEPGHAVPTYAHMKQYVFSQTMPDAKEDQLTVVREDVAAFVAALKQQPGQAIYLCGGGNLAGYLLDCALIDEVILKINPVLFGDGIPLFGKSTRTIALALQDLKVYANGVQFVRYQIAYDRTIIQCP